MSANGNARPEAFQPLPRLSAAEREDLLRIARQRLECLGTCIAIRAHWSSKLGAID